MTVDRLLVGDVAPDFTLPAASGADVVLSSYRGRSTVLLAFFPLAFTRTCTEELCEFSEELKSFSDLSVQVFGVSVDSVPTLQAFRERHGIEVDLLSDFKREVSTAYGTLIQEHNFSDRAYFVVDEQGILRWQHVEQDLGDKRDADELLSVLRTLDNGKTVT